MPKHKITRNYAEGMVALTCGDPRNAIPILDIEPYGSPCKGLALGNSALALLRLEQFEPAEKRFQETFDYIDKHGCPHLPSVAQFMRNFVECVQVSRPLEALGRYKDAFASCSELIAKCGDVDDAEAIELECAHMYNSWGGQLVKLSQYEPAVEKFQEARDIYRKYYESNNVGLAETLTNISLAYQNIPDKEHEAHLALQEALKVATQGKSREQIRRVQMAMIHLDPSLLNEDPYEVLSSAIDEAIDAGHFSTAYIRLCMKTKLANRQADYDVGLDAIQQADDLQSKLDPGDCSPAQLCFEHACLLEAKGSDMPEILAPLLKGADLWWNRLSQPQTYDDFLYISQIMHDHFRLLSRKLIDDQRFDEACMAFEAGRALAFAVERDQKHVGELITLKPFGNPQDHVDISPLKALQNKLAENEVLITPLVLHPDIIAFIIHNDHVEMVKCGLPTEIYEQRKLFDSIKITHLSLQKGIGEQAIPEIIHVFCSKVLSAIDTKRIKAICPHSDFHHIPWRAVFRHAGTEWNQLTFHTAFGLFLFDLGNKDVAQKCKALGCGYADSIDLNQEAHDFATQFGDGGQVVTEASDHDLSISLSDSGIILLSCHGNLLADLNSGRQEFFLTLRNGLTNASTIWPDRINADLVILSACNSGVYDVAWGDYPIGGLPDLLRLGAKQCMGTRFPVNAQFASKLMPKLAKRLAAGDNVGTAFVKALEEQESEGADLWCDLACFELAG